MIEPTDVGPCCIGYAPCQQLPGCNAQPLDEACIHCLSKTCAGDCDEAFVDEDDRADIGGGW